MTAQQSTDVVRVVEAALARVNYSTAQEKLAEQLGFLCHSPISRKLEKVRDGKADGLLSVFTARELIVLARAHRVLGDALIAAIAGRDDGSFGHAVERDLSALGKTMSAELGEIIEDLSDSEIDLNEALNHLSALDKIADQLQQVKNGILQMHARRLA